MFRGKKKIAVRFRNANIALFLLASVILTTTIIVPLKEIIQQVSSDYARNYATQTAEELTTYLVKEISLVKKAARSNEMIDWFLDEDDLEKKARAFDEIMGITDILESTNVYLAIGESLHEYTLEEGSSMDDFKPSATLDPDYYDDAWYFECLASDQEYNLNVDIDKILHRKSVWLNYKVLKDDMPLGIICSGLEFAEVVEELFSNEYDNTKVRGLVIDETGTILMDSQMLGDDDFLHFTNETQMKDEFSNPSFLSTIDQYLGNIDGYFETRSMPTVFEVSEGPYRYATIAPIGLTNWSVVTLFDSTSLFDITKFLPIVAILAALFVAFILASNLISYRLIFSPLRQLVQSLGQLKNNRCGRIYGLEREDEFGTLSHTIQDLFNQSHYDALTGIYNRRFLDTSMSRYISSLSRGEGYLSVCMVDVDFFKNYNDAYGHDVGDICLRTIAQELTKGISRAGDFVARYGGEEFVIVLPNTDEAGARLVAERQLERIRERKMPHANSDVADHVTVSIGLTSSLVNYSQNGEDYIKQADKALYLSKQSGRDRYTYLPFEHPVDISDRDPIKYPNKVRRN